MIESRRLPGLRAFRRAEQRYSLRAADEYRELVVATGNGTRPVHRWFSFKESFSARLLPCVQTALGLGKGIRFVDPFCGVGTSLISAMARPKDFQSIAGIETSPFIAFVAATKAAVHQMNADRVLALGEKSLRETDVGDGDIPALSSFRSGVCIGHHTTRRLRAIVQWLSADGDDVDHDAALLGVASAIETLSNTRKDGRALRVVSKARRNIDTELRKRWEIISSDIKSMRRHKPRSPRVVLGDGREFLRHVDGDVDLVLTSPPYPNNIDYSEVYKLELWLLGYIGTSDDFLKLRRKTFRSHPTCSVVAQSERRAGALETGELCDLLNPILRRIEQIGEPWRAKVLEGYCLDTLQTLTSAYRSLRRRGRCVFVVGNSLHGVQKLPYVVPTDLLVASLGEACGFNVEEIGVARVLKRRLTGNHFLRESVVSLRKP